MRGNEIVQPPRGTGLLLTVSFSALPSEFEELPCCCDRAYISSRSRGSLGQVVAVSTFDAVYQPPPGASDALRPFVERLFNALQGKRLDLAALKAAIMAVLTFLSSPEERTDANCRAVDSFLMKDEVWDADGLPEEYVDVLADMSGALHDTVSAPHVAANFDSTPAQLLERARRL